MCRTLMLVAGLSFAGPSSPAESSFAFPLFFPPVSFLGLSALVAGVLDLPIAVVVAVCSLLVGGWGLSCCVPPLRKWRRFSLWAFGPPFIVLLLLGAYGMDGYIKGLVILTRPWPALATFPPQWQMRSCLMIAPTL